jgi:hypothetical protein
VDDDCLVRISVSQLGQKTDRGLQMVGMWEPGLQLGHQGGMGTQLGPAMPCMGVCSEQRRADPSAQVPVPLMGDMPSMDAW